MHLIVIILGNVVWLGLVALLWYSRPGDVAWLAGSLILGAIYFAAFGWCVTRRR